jgi:hypothetical protein
LLLPLQVGLALKAGIVSFWEKVVGAQSKYFIDLLSKTESPDITFYDKY